MRSPATDFSTVLYLGLTHPSAQLRPWRSLTTGLPPDLLTTPGSRRVAHRLAKLTGTETATIGPSTLHLFWDLFGQVSDFPIRVLADSALYAIAAWGIERAAAAGTPVDVFPHQDPAALASLIAKGGSRPPVVVTDGLCTGCNKVAPLDRYLSLVEETGGWVIVDDSQAMGLLGEDPSPLQPLGFGGGGSMRFLDLRSPRIITVSSLAKAFGVPLAALAGSAATVRSYELQSETRVHSSGPSVVSVRAAENALLLNSGRGDFLRAMLSANIAQFRTGAHAAGVTFEGGRFPVENLTLPRGVGAVETYQRLRDAGVHAVLRKPRCRGEAVISFVIRADHTSDNIDHATKKLERVLRRIRGRRLPEAHHAVTEQK